MCGTDFEYECIFKCIFVVYVYTQYQVIITLLNKFGINSFNKDNLTYHDYLSRTTAVYSLKGVFVFSITSNIGSKYILCMYNCEHISLNKYLIMLNTSR